MITLDMINYFKTTTKEKKQIGFVGVIYIYVYSQKRSSAVAYIFFNRFSEHCDH